MIKDLVALLDNKVNLAIHDGMTLEQESYAAGMADALEVVKEYDNQQLDVGRTYWVIVNDDDKKFHLAPLKLHKITVTPARTTYSFCDGEVLGSKLTGKNNCGVVSLFGKVSIMKRVFRTLEEANRGMELYTPFDPEQSRYRRH